MILKLLSGILRFNTVTEACDLGRVFSIPFCLASSVLTWQCNIPSVVVHLRTWRDPDGFMFPGM